MIENKKIFSYFFAIFLIFGSFLASIIGVLYTLESKDYLTRIELEEQVNLKLQLALTSNNFETIISDLLFLSKQNELLRLINFNEKKYKRWISDEYLELVRRKKVYDQIRYIDKTGMEIVRVNLNNGTPKIVEEKELQLKENRYYFKDAFALGPDEIFVSPLDLNIENGEIETPLKPMIRFGIPVLGEENQKSGIILFNYLAGKMLSSIEEAAKLSLGSAMLINQDGFWLLGPDKEDEWGFMIKDRQDKIFSKRFPGAWPKIVSSENCQFNDENGLFTSATIYPLKQSMKGLRSSSGSSFAVGESAKKIKAGEYFWKLVSHIPKQDINSGMQSLLFKLFFMGGLLFILASIPSWIIAKAMVRRKLHQIQLYHSANYDRLTDLPNRSMFMDKFNEIFKQSRRYERKFALLFIDLDGFKSVNDTLGHDAGDELLIKVSKRLQKSVRDSDVLARLGGDEFTVIFSTIQSSNDPKSGAQKIIKTLSMPFSIKGQSIQIGASIGISIYPDNGDDLELLLQKADSAMYQAKKEGKNDYRMSPV